MKATANQIKMIHFLLNKLQIMEHKREIISEHSCVGSCSSKDLSFAEAKDLIGYLKKFTPEHHSEEKMKRKILHICYNLGWVEDYKGKTKVNYKLLNAFCEKRSYLKKPFNYYSFKELPKLVTQFEQMVNHNQNSEANKAVKGLLNEVGLNVV